MAREIFRLGDGRDRDRAGLAGEDLSSDVDALGRFHVRAQYHAKLLGALGQALYVALKPSTVHKQRWGDQGVDRFSRLSPLQVCRHLVHILIS